VVRHASCASFFKIFTLHIFSLLHAPLQELTNWVHADRTVTTVACPGDVQAQSSEEQTEFAELANSSLCQTLNEFEEWKVEGHDSWTSNCHIWTGDGVAISCDNYSV
jgi:hypothetical protein